MKRAGRRLTGWGAITPVWPRPLADALTRLCNEALGGIECALMELREFTHFTALITTVGASPRPNRCTTTKSRRTEASVARSPEERTRGRRVEQVDPEALSTVIE